MVYTCVSFSAIQLLELPEIQKKKIERLSIDIDKIFISVISFHTEKRLLKLNHKNGIKCMWSELLSIYVNVLVSNEIDYTCLVKQPPPPSTKKNQTTTTTKQKIFYDFKE